ncbi:hypothetical protein Trydic_g7686 [Trypoxylus dichotomus]
MKVIVILICFTATALAVGEKQLKLDDIERDNLATEKKLKHPKPNIPKYSQSQLSQQSQKIIPTSQLEYGFTPLKSTQKYLPQQQPQIEIPQPLQYVYPQYTTPTAYAQFPQYQYQQYENIPYVVDNQLLQNSKTDQQQYYGQQLVYFQPTISPSNNIQMVIDPKGNIKYYTYVPSQYYSEVKNNDDPIKNIQVQTIPPTYNNVGPQIFTREPDYQQLPKNEHQYITQPQLPPQPVTQAIEYIQPTQTIAQQVQYVEPTQESFAKTQFIKPTTTQQPFIASQQLIQPTQLPKTQYVSKGEPQSLLDSYVPSILQLQYYKQQQDAQTNSLGQNPKTLVSRTLSPKQTLRIPNAQTETTYSLSSPYRTHTFKN